MNKCCCDKCLKKALDKAKKKFWYDNDYDKGANHWDANIELNIFVEGWKAALKWADI